MRNLAAFHIDRDVIDKGLAVLVRDNPNTVLCEGDGRKSVMTLLTLGEEALFNGFEIDLATYREFVEKVGDDHGISTAIEEAFTGYHRQLSGRANVQQIFARGWNTRE